MKNLILLSVVAMILLGCEKNETVHNSDVCWTCIEQTVTVQDNDTVYVDTKTINLPYIENEGIKFKNQYLFTTIDSIDIYIVYHNFNCNKTIKN